MENDTWEHECEYSEICNRCVINNIEILYGKVSKIIESIEELQKILNRRISNA